MRKALAIGTIFVLMVVSQPTWAYYWVNPGSNPTTDPPAKAAERFVGLPFGRMLDIKCAIQNRPSYPIVIRHGEYFDEMTGGPKGVKSHVYVSVDSLRAHYWTVGDIQVVQFHDCNNLAWRYFCSSLWTEVDTVFVQTPCPGSSLWEDIKHFPFWLWPVAGLGGLIAYLIGRGSSNAANNTAGNRGYETAARHSQPATPLTPSPTSQSSQSPPGSGS